METHMENNAEKAWAKCRSSWGMKTILTTWFVICTGSVGMGATLNWCGFEWTLRSGTGGPGPNTWNQDNVWVDQSGALHLRIVPDGLSWSCAELETSRRFGFGTYYFEVTGNLATLDPNIVLGLFTYPTPDVGPDGTHEIDIEFAKWGNPSAPVGNYTVWPVLAGSSPTSFRFPFSPAGSDSTHGFEWAPGALRFLSREGLGSINGCSPIASWETPPTLSDQISGKSMPLHINFWLFQGHPPVSGTGAEVIIRSFHFAPYDLTGDGAVNSLDLSALASFLAGNALMPTGSAGDLDIDGEAGITDLVILNWACNR